MLSSTTRSRLMALIEAKPSHSLFSVYLADAWSVLEWTRAGILRAVDTTLRKWLRPIETDEAHELDRYATPQDFEDQIDEYFYDLAFPGAYKRDPLFLKLVLRRVWRDEYEPVQFLASRNYRIGWERVTGVDLGELTWVPVEAVLDEIPGGNQVLPLLRRALAGRDGKALVSALWGLHTTYTAEEAFGTLSRFAPTAVARAATVLWALNPTEAAKWAESHIPARPELSDDYPTEYMDDLDDLLARTR